MVHPVKNFETWYEATTSRGEAHESLRSRISVDACVIGGGLAGISTARELQRRGLQVVLLEANRLAWGASGRNGGFVSSGFATDISEVATQHGLETARRLYRLSHMGVTHIANEISMHDPSIRMGDGVIVAWRYPNRDEVQKHIAKMAHDYGHQLEFLGREPLRLLCRSERYFAGFRNNEAFHVHPLRYALLQASRAASAGVKIFENTKALAVQKDGGLFKVRTAAGEISAPHVIHCVSSLDRTIHAPTGRAILPISTYMVATARLDQDAIVTRSAIADTRRAGDYYRVSDDGRILWGGRITTRASAPLQLGRMLRDDMTSLYPQLGTPQIDYAWAGTMGYALHKMPLIGRDATGQWYATAFGGHGMNTTVMAGLLIARAIAEGDDEYRRFEIFSPRWAGGLLGRVGVQSSYWWMQLRDRVDEAKSVKAEA